ncbi:unnamed protein product [Haemonchus placei]|uniref:UBX domain-containing protein n=1 Tax=Haemonchus placei TaxID=6290 RepID=A0A0N4X4E1_HAEPC|nr:unnamed protein product [Haemonchus placei]
MMCPRADNRFFSAPLNPYPVLFVGDSLVLLIRVKYAFWESQKESDGSANRRDVLVVRRISGFTTAEDLVSRLEKAIETVRVDLKDLREQRDKLIEDRRLMQEQEKAYRESIERDKQKMLEAKKAIQEKQEADERKKQKQREEMERRKLIACQRENLRLQVDESPVSGTTVHVQVRFPSGKKFSKKFAVDDSLEKLFTAILCYENCPDFFTVSAGYPRTQVNCAPEWYYIVLSEQLLAEGLAPYKFKPPLTFRAAGFAKPTGVFVNAYGS